jgi:Mce-associated membrane protein
MTTAQSDVEGGLVSQSPAIDGRHQDADPSAYTRRRVNWKWLLVYILVPAVAMGLALGAGYLRWRGTTLREADFAGIESVRAATDGAIALLSYQPDTVEKDLEAARSRLTGQFGETYDSLTHDVVIPGARQKQIAATATVPAAASVSASPSHAEVLLFVNQTITIGKGAPTSTASSVRVVLDKIDNRWLISQFDPV